MEDFLDGTNMVRIIAGVAFIVVLIVLIQRRRTKVY